MKLIYVLGPAHGKVEEFTPPLGGFNLPPEFMRQEVATDSELGRLSIRYGLVYFDAKEAYYIPQRMSKGFAIRNLAQLACLDMTGEK